MVTCWSKPFDSPEANKIETFNMAVQIMLLYIMMCFSDFTDGPEIRHELGMVFVALVCAFIIFHVLILLFALVQFEPL